MKIKKITALFILITGFCGMTIFAKALILKNVIEAPPGVSKDDEHFKLGYLNVKKSPYLAKGNGESDDTAALQNAILDAYKYNLAVFLPAGEYLVSNTLDFKQTQKELRNPQGKISKRSTRKFVHVMMGSYKNGKRPVIKLKDNSFKDIKDPRPVIHFYNEKAENVHFAATFRNIDIDLGKGNNGAIGLQMIGAEGCSATETRVFSSSGDQFYAGLYGLNGSGGTQSDIEVEGGDYGIISPDRMTPTIIGLKLYNQSKAAIWDQEKSGPLTIVGFEIKKNNGTGVLIAGTSGEKKCLDPGGINLVDGSIEIPGDDGLAIKNNGTVYLHNAFIKAKHIMSNGAKRESKKQNLWYRITDYAHTMNNGKEYTEGVYIIEDGKRYETMPLNAAEVAAPPSDLIRRHLWGKGCFSFEYPGVYIASELNGADDKDDTSQLQAIVNEHKKIFLPKGMYKITRPITLKKDTQITGCAKNLTLLIVDPDKWSVKEPSCMVETEDSADAVTSISFIGLINYPIMSNVGFVKWQAGRHSVIRDVYMGNVVWGDESKPKKVSDVWITGNGGGKWYTRDFDWGYNLGTGLSPFRHVLIENTHEPLSFYGINVHYAPVDPQLEVRKSANVNFFNLKGEGNYDILHVVDSRNISVIGYGGNGCATPGRSLILLKNSEDILIANMKTVYHTPYLYPKVTVTPDKPILKRGTWRKINFDGHYWDAIKDISPKGTYEIKGDCYPLLYKQGVPVLNYLDK